MIYSHFVEICALELQNKSEETEAEEVEAALRLFTKGIDRAITIQDLRNVARTLKEDVGDDVLRAMILEANGGAGVNSGVDKEGFREVMMRAGVFKGA